MCCFRLNLVLKTHHRPRCPPACRRGPSSAPQGTDSQGCQRSLKCNDKQKSQNMNYIKQGYLFFLLFQTQRCRSLKTTANDGIQAASSQIMTCDKVTCPQITPLIIWPCWGERGSRSVGPQPRQWPRRELVSVSERLCHYNSFANIQTRCGQSEI